MPGGKGKYRRYRRKGRGKRKWRQQKLAIGTVQKIARQVAKYEIKEKEEPKFSLVLLGGTAANSASLPVRCIITKSGLYQMTPLNTGFLSNASQTSIQHHPITYPSETALVGQQGQRLKLDSGANYRIGDTINLTGVGLKGFLCLGKDCQNAQVYCGIHKAEQTIDTPIDFMTTLDGMEIRRQINNAEKLNGTKAVKRWSLNHRANEQEVKIPVNMYLSLNKRIRYDRNQPDRDAGNMSQDMYDDLRYYLVFYSDVPDEVLPAAGGGVGPAVPVADQQAVYDRFPTFYGRWTAYYRDA